MPIDIVADVLITGGHGFLGSAIRRELNQRAIHNFSIRSSDYDLRDSEQTRALFHAWSPDRVIHAAAHVGGIQANAANPGSFFYDNAMMGLNVIEQARLVGVKKVVIIGTVCAYPKHPPLPFKESDLWNGYPEETNAPYGIAKRMLLTMAQAYREQYGMNIIYVLPTNLYGPGETIDPTTSHVIPALIAKFLEARRTGAPFVEVWGDGSATRDFLYVDDAARGIVDALEEYDSPEPMNLGSGSEVSIAELASLIARMTAYEGQIAWLVDRPNGQPRRVLDIGRAQRHIGFLPRTSLTDGLSQTINWHAVRRLEVEGAL